MAEPKPQSRRHCMGQRGAPISCGLPVSQGCLYWSGREPVGRRHPSFARHSSSSPQARESDPRQEASPKIISSQKVGGRDPIRTGTSALGKGWCSTGLSYAPTDRLCFRSRTHRRKPGGPGPSRTGVSHFARVIALPLGYRASGYYMLIVSDGYRKSQQLNSAKLVTFDGLLH